MRLFLIRYKTIVFAVILLLISVWNMSKGIDTERIYLRTYIFEWLLNFEKSILHIKTSMVDVFANAKNIRQLEKELENAEKEILYYKELSRLYTHLKQENEQLQAILQMKSNIQYTTHYSKVIFRDPSLLSDYLIIDKGYNSGINNNMPVVFSDPQEEGLILVGKIIEVGADFSRVRVITAKNFYLGVKILESGYVGILRGQGSWNQNLVLDYIPIDSKPNINEKIITTGESSIYPEGLYIGTIQGIRQNSMEEFFQTLYIKSKFEYSKITEVFILDYQNEYISIEGEIENGL